MRVSIRHGRDALGAIAHSWDDPFFITITCDGQTKITLTKLTLDGTDISSQVTSTTGTSFVVGIRNIALGSHTLLVDGTDEVGNKLAADTSTKFNVAARPQYSLALQPDMNLVSLPGAPADPSINTVIPSTLKVNSIVTYDPTAKGGPWLVATRNATTGLLEGTLTSIDANHAYWIDSTTAQTLKVTIPKQGFQSIPNDLPLVMPKGWNLVAVRDLSLRPIGTGIPADDYFRGIEWVVAYTFDSVAGLWQRILPKQTPAHIVKVGAGYWVYVARSERVSTELPSSKPMIWWDWWFGQSAIKKTFASILLTMLFIYTLAPLFTFGVPGSYPNLLKTLSLGHSWEQYVLPVATILLVLFSPMLRRIGSQGIEMGPIPSRVPVPPREYPQPPDPIS